MAWLFSEGILIPIGIPKGIPDLENCQNCIGRKDAYVFFVRDSYVSNSWAPLEIRGQVQHVGGAARSSLQAQQLLQLRRTAAAAMTAYSSTGCNHGLPKIMGAFLGVP